MDMEFNTHIAQVKAVADTVAWIAEEEEGNVPMESEEGEQSDSVAFVSSIIENILDMVPYLAILDTDTELDSNETESTSSDEDRECDCSCGGQHMSYESDDYYDMEANVTQEDSGTGRRRMSQSQLRRMQ